jgi:hypothetical protein
MRMCRRVAEEGVAKIKMGSCIAGGYHCQWYVVSKSSKVLEKAKGSQNLVRGSKGPGVAC